MNVILRTTGPADNVAASLRQLFQDENVLGGALDGQAGLLLVVGLGIGCALALAIGRTAGTLLFGLQPNDPLSFAMSVLALGVVALAAAYLPAARATRMSPLDGLRAD